MAICMSFAFIKFPSFVNILKTPSPHLGECIRNTFTEMELVDNNSELI